MEQAEHRSQIYLVVPGDVDPARLNEVIACDAFPAVSCVLLRTSERAGNDALAHVLLPACHEANIPLLIENDTAYAKQLGADGVHVAGDENAVANARATLGDNAIVGASCDATRHMAMSLTEQGADYVAFSHGNPEELVELVDWWSDVTVVPCVAWDIHNMETVERMASAGADFISFDALVWSNSDSATTALKKITDRLSGFGSMP